MGPDVRDIETSAGTKVVDIPVATTDVVYTKAFSLSYGEYFALAYKCTSDGNVKVKIEIELSFQLPTTEGVADDTYKTYEGASAIESSLADETQHLKAITPPALKYGRIKLTGLGAPSANDASTTIRLRIGQRDLSN